MYILLTTLLTFATLATSARLGKRAVDYYNPVDGGGSMLDDGRLLSLKALMFLTSFLQLAVASESPLT